MPTTWGKRVLRAKEGGTEWTLDNLHADGVPLSETLAEMEDQREFEPVSRYDAITFVYGKEAADADAAGQPAPSEVDLEETPQVSKLDEARNLIAREDEMRKRREETTAIQIQQEEDDSPGFLAETGKALWGGVVDGVAEMSAYVADELGTSFGAKAFTAAATTLKGEDVPTAIEALEQEVDLIQEDIRSAASTIAPPNESVVGGMARGFTQYLAPYVGIMKAAKVAQITNVSRGVIAAEGISAGFIIDYTMFDPDAGNLSNLIEELAPSMKDSALTFLATDVNDTEAEKRLKNGLEGSAVGGVLEGIFKVARMVKAAKAVEKVRADTTSTGLDRIKVEAETNASKKQAILDDVKVQIEDVEGRPVVETDEGGRITAKSVGSQTDFEVKSQTQLVDSMRTELEARKANGEAFKTAEKKLGVEERRLAKMQDKAAKEAEAAAKVEAEAPRAEEAPRAPHPETENIVEGMARIQRTLKIDGTTRAALNQALLDGKPDEAIEILKDFNIDTINWNKIEGAEDIKHILNTFSDVLGDQIDEVASTTQSNAFSERMAKLVGATGEDVHRLHGGLTEGPGLTVRMLAAEQTMLSSARKLFELRTLSKNNPDNLEFKKQFLRQTQIHFAIQAEVKGAKREIARALQGMKILTEEADEGFQEFNTILKQMGEKTGDRKAYEKYMDTLLEGSDGDLRSLNEATRRTTSELIKDGFIEYTINSMLSSPKTHIINLTSNILNSVLYTMDRSIAGAYRRVRYGDRAALQEAKLDAVTKIKGLGEALTLAKQAWVDGAPVTDKRQRMEYLTRRAIGAEGTSYWTPIANKYRALRGRTDQVVPPEGTWLAKAVNTIGETVRIPGRALIAGDEFFKAVTRNSEVAVLAYRQADGEAVQAGLHYGTPEYDNFIKQRTATLSDPLSTTDEALKIRTAAVQKSRLATFQESARTNLGSKMESFVNANRWVKLVFAPFFRTPMNILRQGLIDRTPLGRFMDDVKVVLENGNPREQAEIQARMYTSIGALAAIVPFVGNEDSGMEIVGKLPANSSKKLKGIVDYSIRLGDTWYQFNRLDPLGMWLGMAADMKLHSDTVGFDDDGLDEVTFAYAQGAIAGLMNNSVNKTWAKSLSDFLELAKSFGDVVDDPSAVKRGIARFTAGQFGKLVPQLAKSVGRGLIDGDELYAKEAWTFLDNLSSQMPGFNDSLPQRHDPLGRPIAWDNTMLSVVNPFTISENPTQLEKELAALDFNIQPIPKKLASGLVELTAAEYSEINRLVGSVNLGAGTLEQTLEAMIADPSWATTPDGLRTIIVQKYISAARKAAIGTFLASRPDMLQKLTDARVESAEEIFR